MNSIVWRIGTILLWPLTHLVMRARRVGTSKLPESGSTLIVCNHLSSLDPPLVGMMALPRPVHFMAKAELFRTRFGGWVVRSVGAFPVKRGAGDRDAIRMSREILRRGDCLVMFPEGTRSRSGAIRPFFPGAGVLAMEPGVTVIPAAIWGSQRMLGPVRVVFGEPIDLSDIAEGSGSARARVATERMQRAIMDLIPDVGGPPQVMPQGEPSLEKY